MKNIWERAVVLPLQFFLRPGSTLLDLGSNIGEVAASIAEGSRNVFVVSIEANPNLIPKIEDCFSRNSISRFEILNNAVWLESGKTLSLSLDESTYSTSSSIFYKNTSDKTFETMSIAVDDLSDMWPRISVIKVDVEGAEFEALKGAEKTILRDYPVIAYERSPGKSEVDHFLRSMSYKLYLSNTLELMTSHNFKDDDGIYNILAIPPTVGMKVNKEYVWGGLDSPKLHPGLYVSHVEIDSSISCENGVGVWNVNENFWETAYVTNLKSLAHFTNSTLLFDLTSVSKVQVRMTDKCSHNHILSSFTESLDIRIQDSVFLKSHISRNKLQHLKSILSKINS